MYSIILLRPIVLTVLLFGIVAGQKQTQAPKSLPLMSTQPTNTRIVAASARLNLSFKEAGSMGNLIVAGELYYRDADSISVDEVHGLHVVKGGQAHLHAGNVVHIGPGLHVEEGAIFTVTVDEKKLVKGSAPMNAESLRSDSEKSMPLQFELFGNYPNPFNPLTVIRYALPQEAYVTLKVFNALGQEVNTLVDETQGPGFMSQAFDASNLPSGVFFYRLTAGSHVAIKKMILLK